jgi:hypothetical protein
MATREVAKTVFEGNLAEFARMVRSLSTGEASTPPDMVLGFIDSNENEEEVSYLLDKRVRVTIEAI